ncbi:hypothetical protein EMIHUDRAFT_439862 [Emiliania huxleyi CCMP1516]|uniref:PH domain-containing protein n=2 Tax=Emiliania huxleyi TaxID=2903 RepID=A0A0D3KUD1_EMIH1|nr:hypothetical protein EMIHUDRAFT_439862 [Emiliania huxleyi CCMP1516]EOD39366.1 hypothetical protein EMIHUDRAFT_439862 [Emiliania huxleyi CCMP1516]|eukprot:XP_005791795.1 hypothetical protein EMIHUDRAFT_439862 [Emiliania huxleyi CCMP1516]
MDTLLRKFNLNVDTRERDIERAGFVGAQQQALDVNQEHALMEIRFQHMTVRTEWLNNLNTQAAFIAGISIAWLGGDVLAEVSDEVVFANSDGTPIFLDKLLKLTYLLFATLSGGAGLWVVIYSNRLIILANQAALTGASMRDVRASDEIVQRNVRKVDEMFVICLGSLVGAICCVAWLREPGSAALVITVTFTLLVVHAIVNTIALRDEFHAKTNGAWRALRVEKESQDPCECLYRLSGGALKAEAPREVQGASKPLHLEVSALTASRAAVEKLRADRAGSAALPLTQRWWFVLHCEGTHGRLYAFGSQDNYVLREPPILEADVTQFRLLPRAGAPARRPRPPAAGGSPGPLGRAVTFLDPPPKAAGDGRLILWPKDEEECAPLCLLIEDREVADVWYKVLTAFICSVDQNDRFTRYLPTSQRQRSR